MGQRDQREKARAKRVSALDWAKDQDKGFAATSVLLPEGVEFYKLAVGVHVVDFMEYPAPAGHPKADAGSPLWVREFTAHGIVGPNGRSSRYVCRWETFGKPCPACKWYNENAKTADEKLARDMRGKKRHLYLLNAKPGVIPGSKDNPYKVLDQGYYNRGMGFGEMLIDAVQSAKARNPDAVYFFAPDSGFSVQLTVKEMTGGDFKYNGVARIDLIPRKHNYDERLSAKAPCPDTMLVDLGEKGMRDLIYQGGAAEDDPAAEGEGDATEANGAGREGVSFGTGPGPYAVGDYVLYDGIEHEVLRVSQDGTRLLLEDPEGEKIRGVSPDACEPVPVQGGDTDDDEDSPDTEDEDDDEVEEDAENEDDEETAPRGRGKSARGKSPAGGDDEDDDSAANAEDDEDADDEEEEELTADEDVGDGDDEDDEGPAPPKKKPVPPAKKPAPGKAKPTKKYGH